MAFIVLAQHNGQAWPLRGTTFAFAIERAQRFDTREQAQAAIEKAKPFHKARVMKTAQIVEVE